MKAAPPNVSPDALFGLISSVARADDGRGEGAEPASRDRAPERAEPTTPVMSTWPPAGIELSPATLEVIGKGLGPVQSRHRWSATRRRTGRRVAAVILVLAAAGGAGGWYLKHRAAATPGATWDSRVAGLASFVQSETGLKWGHALDVTFVSPSQWSADVAGTASKATGANVARWSPSSQVLYVDSPGGASAVPDAYTALAIVGQMASALETGSAPGSTGPAVPAATAAVRVSRVEAAYGRSLPAAARAALAREERAGR